MIDYHYPEDPKCLVYMAINLTNNKIYIGITEKGLRARQIRHIWNAKNGRPGKFYNAIRKYGEDKFWFVTLIGCRDYWHALEEERLYISIMKPAYNMTAGGGGVKGFKFSAESKKKMSLAKKGKPGHSCSPISAAKLGAWSRSQKGIKITDPVRLLKSQAATKMANAKRRRPVKCSNTGIIFGSTTEAAKYYGLTTGQVTVYCRNKFRSRRGIKLEYVAKNGGDGVQY